MVVQRQACHDPHVLQPSDSRHASGGGIRMAVHASQKPSFAMPHIGQTGTTVSPAMLVQRSHTNTRRSFVSSGHGQDGHIDSAMTTAASLQMPTATSP